MCEEGRARRRARQRQAMGRQNVGAKQPAAARGGNKNTARTRWREATPCETPWHQAGAPNHLCRGSVVFALLTCKKVSGRSPETPEHTRSGVMRVAEPNTACHAKPCDRHISACEPRRAPGREGERVDRSLHLFRPWPQAVRGESPLAKSSCEKEPVCRGTPTDAPQHENIVIS